MKEKIGGFLALFLLCFTTLSYGDIVPEDAYSGNDDYENYYGIKLGQPTPIEHPKDIKAIPSKETPAKEYRLLAIVITERTATPLVNSNDINTLINAERLPKESDLAYQKRLPYGAKTSMRQYFLDQSNGKFKISATIFDRQWKDLSFRDDDDERVYATLEAIRTFGSLSSTFDGLIFVHATNEYASGNIDSYGQAEAYGAGAEDYDSDDLNEDKNGLYTYDLPVQIHRATDKGINVRELCVATAYSICGFPPLYASPKHSLTIDQQKGISSKIYSPYMNMAGFCLMGGLVPSAAANVVFEDHPPSINSYYKIKAGWVDQLDLDQQSKIRVGTQHEGRVAYTYKPNYDDDTLSVTAKRYRNIDEYFILENRQNLNYEAGTIIEESDVPSNRGIFNPNKPGSSKDSVNPAQGLVVYHIDEEHYTPDSSADDSFFMGVIDATWGERSDIDLAYPRAVPVARAPWRVTKDAAFRKLAPVLSNVGNEIVRAEFDVETNETIFFVDGSANGAGAYDEDGFVNPPGCVRKNSSGTDYYLSVRDMFEAAGISFEDSLAKGVRGHAEDYLSAKNSYLGASSNSDDELAMSPITEFGQYDSQGQYAPSGGYIFKDPDWQRNPGRHFDENYKVNVQPVSSFIMKAPRGTTGYISAEGVYQPGGGYEPFINRPYRKDIDGDFELDDAGNKIVDYSQAPIFVPKAGGTIRPLFQADGTPLAEVVSPDYGGNYVFLPAGKDLIHQYTEPALEFMNWTYKKGKVDVTTIKAPGVGGASPGAPQVATNALTPVFSNISFVDETMTTEISSYDYYFFPTQDHGMQDENGFLRKKHQNGLGVALKPDELQNTSSTAPNYVSSAVYDSYRKGMYNRYNIDMDINYFDVPDELKVGIWNSGGQSLSYDIKMKHTDHTVLVTDGAGNGDAAFSSVMTDRAHTLQFKFDFDGLTSKFAGQPFPWKYRFPFCKIEWDKIGGDNDGRRGSAEFYMTLTIKSPPHVIAAADIDFNLFQLKPEMDPTNAPGLEGLMTLDVPQYAQEVIGNMWLINAGGTTLRYKLVGDQLWFAGNPTNSFDDAVEQWLGGYSFGNYRMTLLVKDLIAAGGLSKTLSGKVRVFSDNLHVKGAPKGPEYKPGQQSVNVRVNVLNTLPPGISSLRLISDRTRDEVIDSNIYLRSYSSASVSDLTDAYVRGQEHIEITAPYVYPIFLPVPDITHYLVYLSRERRTNGPKPEDLYTIIHRDTYNFDNPIYIPTTDEVYYVWVKTVAINDEDIEAELTDPTGYYLFNPPLTDSALLNLDTTYVFDRRLGWLTSLRGNGTSTVFDSQIFNGLFDFLDILFFDISDGDFYRYDDLVYEKQGAYPLHLIMDTTPGTLAQAIDKSRLQTRADVYNYYNNLSDLMQIRKAIEKTDPFRLLDLYEIDLVTSKGSNSTTLPGLMNRLGVIYRDSEKRLTSSYEDYAAIALAMGNSSLDYATMVYGVAEFDGSLDDSGYQEWNALLGTSFKDEAELTAALAGASNVDASRLQAVIEALQNIYADVPSESYVDYTYTQALQFINIIWNDFTGASPSVTKWRNMIGKTVFYSDDYSNRCTVKRNEVGAPLAVKASDNYADYVQVSWNFTSPGDGKNFMFDEDDFEVWRSKRRGFNNAVRIDNGDIEIINSIAGLSGDLSALTYFSDYDPDNLYSLTFRLLDRDAKPYPAKYYYYVKTVVDQDSDTARRGDNVSKSVSGGRAKNIEELFPIVDNNDDDDSDFYDSSRGSVEFRSRNDDAGNMAVRMSRSAPNSRALVGSSLTDSLYDASIIKYLDLSGFNKGEVVMSFDYKFESPDDKGYVTVLADGKEVFVSYAQTAGKGWHKTGYIDLSQFTGRQLKLEIGLVCDVLHPSQSLWLDNLYIAGKRYSPCWELFSSPVADALSNVLNIDYGSNVVYSWSNSKDDYVGHSTIGLNVDAGNGYWMFVDRPFSSADINLPGSKQSLLGSKLSSIPTGWSLCGPVNDVILKDRNDMAAPVDSSVDYLNNYTNLCAVEAYTDSNGQNQSRYVLKATIWEWDANMGKYLKVKDRLEAGKAYWIFKY